MRPLLAAAVVPPSRSLPCPSRVRPRGRRAAALIRKGLSAPSSAATSARPRRPATVRRSRTSSRSVEAPAAASYRAAARRRRRRRLRSGGAYTAPRALTLFSTLTVNADWLASHALTGPRPDIEGDDGAVYRFFSAHGYVFHPLANFAKLNAEVAAKDDAATAHLAAALLARAGAVGSVARLGVRVPVRLGPCAVDVGDGPGGRRAGVRARRHAALGPEPARRGRCGLRRRPEAALPVGAGEALDRALQLRPRACPERPAPGGALGRRLRDDLRDTAPRRRWRRA